MSYLFFYNMRRYIAALVQAGKTPEEAKDIVDRANKGDAAAQAEAQAAVQSDPSKFQYKQLERPRLLEEGLPIPPDYVFLIATVYLIKKHPEMLQKLAEKFMDTQAKIIGALADGGKANIITAYSNSFLIALMLEQNYMIRQRGADDLIASLNVLTTADMISKLVESFHVPETLQSLGNVVGGIAGLP